MSDGQMVRPQRSRPISAPRGVVCAHGGYSEHVDRATFDADMDRGWVIQIVDEKNAPPQGLFDLMLMRRR